MDEQERSHGIRSLKEFFRKNGEPCTPPKRHHSYDVVAIHNRSTAGFDLDYGKGVHGVVSKHSLWLVTAHGTWKVDYSQEVESLFWDYSSSS